MLRRVVPPVFFLLLALPVAMLRAQWVQTAGPGGGRVYALFPRGDTLLAGTYDGPYLSTNRGAHWSPIAGPMAGRYLYACTTAGGGAFLLAGTDQGVFRSTDGGQTWSESDSMMGAKSVDAFVQGSAGLFAGSLGGGLYLTTDNGATWNTADSGLRLK